MQINYKEVGYKFLWVSLIANFFLFILKLIAGYKSNSVALTADAFDTFSDTITSSIIFFGFWVANQPPDKEHPFGHGRAESISAIIIATLITLAGIKILQDAIIAFSTPRVINYGIFEISIFTLSIFVKIALFLYGFRLSKATNSPTIKSDAIHHRSDAISTLLVVIATFFSSTYLWIDSILGIFVTIVILYSAYEIYKSSISILLGEEPDKEVISKVTSIINEVNPNIKDLHEIKLHQYGNHYELTMHVTMPGEMTVNDAYLAVDRVEKEIFNTLNLKATIHIEPHRY